MLQDETTTADLRRRDLRLEQAFEQRRTRPSLVPQFLFELEREMTHRLARHVLPWVPGTHLLYDWQLRRRLTLSTTRVVLPGLADGWHGTRVLLLSDLHAGPFVSPTELERSLRLLVEATAPELILIAGDLLSSHVRELRDLDGALRVLQAPLGTWAVLGNHDHYTLQPELVARGIEDRGVPVLHNTHRRLTRGGDPLVLAGVDDLVMGAPDLEAALEGVGESDTVVLLSHNPDLFFDGARRGVDLQLSGHTHGGQIRLPSRRPPMMASKYPLVNGHYRFETGDGRQAQLLLSEGLGVVGLPLRITCTPEAIAFDLLQEAAPASAPANTVVA